jgi:hypothetical protein
MIRSPYLSPLVNVICLHEVPTQDSGRMNEEEFIPEEYGTQLQCYKKPVTQDFNHITT